MTFESSHDSFSKSQQQRSGRAARRQKQAILVRTGPHTKLVRTDAKASFSWKPAWKPIEC
ncbi:hypothetical protein PSAC2689_20517 [Paraburkholderia sacchari]